MAGKKSVTAKAIQQAFFEEHGIVSKKVSIKKKCVAKTSCSIITEKEFLDEKSFGIYIRNINKWHPSKTKLTIMKDSEILEKLIKDYSDKLNYIKSKVIEDNYFKVHEDICIGPFCYGICNTSYLMYGVSISNKEWVCENKRTESHYWYDIPFQCYNFESIIKSFEFRINKMKVILKTILYE